jgi:photosystem II protein
MNAEIQIFPEKKENRFPIIKLTKSINGKTGTATFFFIEPISFEYFFLNKESIEIVSLIKDEKKISSKNITIFFKNGKPFLLRVIFILKNSSDWFDFLNFMNSYAKENGFFFKEENFFHQEFNKDEKNLL